MKRRQQTSSLWPVSTPESPGCSYTATSYRGSLQRTASRASHNTELLISLNLREKKKRKESFYSISMPQVLLWLLILLRKKKKKHQKTVSPTFKFKGVACVYLALLILLALFPPRLPLFWFSALSFSINGDTPHVLLCTFFFFLLIQHS